MDYSERIKSLRESHGLTQAKFGELVGVSGPAVFKWEKGKSEPDITALGKMADVFGVSIDYLIGRESKEPDIPQPDDVAAHTDGDMSPEMKAEIEKIARKVYEKYAKGK